MGLEERGRGVEGKRGERKETLGGPAEACFGELDLVAEAGVERMMGEEAEVREEGGAEVIFEEGFPDDICTVPVINPLNPQVQDLN